MRNYKTLSCDIEMSEVGPGWTKVNPEVYTYRVDFQDFKIQFTCKESLTEDGVILKIENLMKDWLTEKISNTNGNK